MKINKIHILLLLSLLLSCLDTPAQAQNPDTRFGIVQTYDDFATATQLGVGFTRVKFYWDIIQPNGAEDWQPANIPDPLIATDLAAGREVIGLIVRTPAWARDVHHPANDPRHPTPKDVPDMAAWGQFVRKLAQYYNGRINHWIIWNEPDVWDKQHPGNTWLGSPQDYVVLLKTAYLNIKSAQPQAKVYLTGLTYFWDYEAKQEQYLAHLLALIASDPQAAAHHFYFDGVIYHLYYKPDMIYGLLQEVRFMLDHYNLTDTPIWLAETNAAPTADPLEPPHFQDLPYQVTLTEQAAFMVQLHALVFASGVERVQIYKLFNSATFPEDPRPFGLLRGDKSARPALAAYQTVIRYLAHFQTVQLYRQAEVTQVIFQRDHERVTVLWNEAATPRQIQLTGLAPQTIMVNEAGLTQTITLTEEQYTLDLPAAECSGGECFIGGAPRLFVETEPSAPYMLTVMTPAIPHEADPVPWSKRQLAAGIFGLSVLLAIGLMTVWGWQRRAEF